MKLRGHELRWSHGIPDLRRTNPLDSRPTWSALEPHERGSLQAPPGPATRKARRAHPIPCLGLLEEERRLCPGQTLHEARSRTTMRWRRRRQTVGGILERLD